MGSSCELTRVCSAPYPLVGFSSLVTIVRARVLTPFPHRAFHLSALLAHVSTLAEYRDRVGRQHYTFPSNVKPVGARDHPILPIVERRVPRPLAKVACHHNLTALHQQPLVTVAELDFYRILLCVAQIRRRMP